MILQANLQGLLSGSEGQGITLDIVLKNWFPLGFTWVLNKFFKKSINFFKYVSNEFHMEKDCIL